ncbi:MAG: hypothetical protein KDE27_08260 [Planctomycetes bacterium]|nr:hypothetical protein [Planctomycetota bacterium]
MNAAIALALLATGCAAAPEPAAAAAAPEPVPTSAATDDRLTLLVRFEPALPHAAELVVLHESGERLVVPTGRSGAEVRLPPGPVTLQLELDGTLLEQVLILWADAEMVFATDGGRR